MGKNPHGLGSLAERLHHEHAETDAQDVADARAGVVSLEQTRAARRDAEAENAQRRGARLFGGERRMGERRDPNSAGAPFRGADRRKVQEKAQDSAAQAQKNGGAPQAHKNGGAPQAHKNGSAVQVHLDDSAMQAHDVAAFEAELHDTGKADAEAQDTEFLQLDMADAESVRPQDGTADAHALHEHLAEEVSGWDRQDVPVSPEPETPAPESPEPESNDGAEPADGAEPGDAVKPNAAHRAFLWRIGKSLVLLVAVVTLGWKPMQRFWTTTSAEATVNARVVTLRAPIAGKVTIPVSATEVGVMIGAGAPLLSIDNPRVDRTQMDILRREISGLKTERKALQSRKGQLDTLLVTLQAQADAFQKGRVEQLEARAAALTAEIAAAVAEVDEAKLVLARSAKLQKRGWQTDAALDEATREHKVAANTAQSLRHKLAVTHVELEGARRGLFVGDSYNDIPRSAQRLNQVSEAAIELDGKIEHASLRIAELQAEYEKERERFEVRSTARLTAPVPGRIWEVLTSDGEQVFHGQDLMRVLDCSGVLVTAAVSEAVFNELRLGQPATFHLRGESEEREGRVIGLHGLASTPANLAIEQKALGREPYHVSVEVPNLASGPDCHVGRTGKVTFNTSSTAGTTASIR